MGLVVAVALLSELELLNDLHQLFQFLAHVVQFVP
jgi:hypothetical protein